MSSIVNIDPCEGKITFADGDFVLLSQDCLVRQYRNGVFHFRAPNHCQSGKGYDFYLGMTEKETRNQVAIIHRSMGISPINYTTPED